MTIVFREADVNDAERFIALRSRLFRETTFMLREPHEYRPTLSEESAYIASLASSPHSTLLLAFAEDELAGFICAMGYGLARKRHVANVFLGVVRAHWGRGIATAMLERIVEWAPRAGIERLELKVGTENSRAKSLYERLGFVVEGTARSATKIDGVLKDEYMMGLLV